MANENEPPTGPEWRSLSRPGPPTKRLALGRESRVKLLRDLIAGVAVEEVDYAPGSVNCYHSPAGLDAAEIRALYRIISAAVYSLSAGHVPTVSMMETYVQRVCVAFAGRAILSEHRPADCINGIPEFGRVFRNSVGIGTVKVNGRILEVKEHIEMTPHNFGTSATLVVHTRQGPSPVDVFDVFDTFTPYPNISSNMQVARASLMRDVVATYTRTTEILALDYGVLMIEARLRGEDVTKLIPCFEQLWQDRHDGIDRGQVFAGDIVSLFGQPAAWRAWSAEGQSM